MTLVESSPTCSETSRRRCEISSTLCPTTDFLPRVRSATHRPTDYPLFIFNITKPSKQRLCQLPPCVIFEGRFRILLIQDSMGTVCTSVSILDLRTKEHLAASARPRLRGVSSFVKQASSTCRGHLSACRRPRSKHHRLQQMSPKARLHAGPPILG